MENLSVSRVMAHRIAGQLDAAREMASAYCLANKDDATGWYEAGLVERLCGDFAQAVKYQTLALQIDPNLFGAALDMGISQREMADYPAAIASLLEAARIDQKHFAPQYYLGMIYLSLRELESATQFFLKALVIDPASVDALFMAGLCARYSRRYDDSDRYFRDVVRLQPHHTMAAALIGQADVLKKLEVITDRLLQNDILEVTCGPFKGLRYIRPVVADNLYFNLAQKLAGLHECELWLAFDYLLKQSYSRIVNIGCAEGFYAVGFALRFPQASVHAYDIEPIERKHCLEMALINGVESRVHVKGRCGHVELNDVIDENTLVICDIEGGEKALLDSEYVPNLKRATVLVELHDLYDSTISTTIIGRFRDSHDICIIGSVDKSISRFDGAVSGITEEMLAVIEGRGTSMQWALMVPLDKFGG